MAEICERCKNEDRKVYARHLCRSCYNGMKSKQSPNYTKINKKRGKDWRKKHPKYAKNYYKTHKSYWQNYWLNVEKGRREIKKLEKENGRKRIKSIVGNS